MTLRIKEILKEKGMTQQNLADALGCSLQNVKTTLNAPSMTTATLERYAYALSVPVWQLVVSPSEVLESLGETAHSHNCPNCGRPLSILVL